MIRIFVISGTFISDTSNREFPRRFLNLINEVFNFEKTVPISYARLLPLPYFFLWIRERGSGTRAGNHDQPGVPG